MLGLLRRLIRRTGAPLARAPVVEELEPRILYSADVNPLAWAGDAAGPSAIVAAVDGSATTASTTVDIQQQRRHEIVFVDAAVADGQTLIDDLLAQRATSAEIEVVQLRADQDGLAQIGAVLSGEKAVDAVHLIAHGDAGQLRLGSTLVGLDQLRAHGDAGFAAWRRALGEDADILLWGCRVGEGDAGAAFVAYLARVTDADVAASVDLTGSAGAGGDWTLESTVGAVHANQLFANPLDTRWSGSLAIYTVINTNDSGAGSLRQAIIDANNNAGADAITFNLGGSGVRTISLVSALPTITGQVTLDASSQPGYAGSPLVRIDGNGLGSANGLTLADGSDGSVIRGLMITRWSGDGIQVQAGADGVTIAGNWIGTTGVVGVGGNADDGIDVMAINATIGGAGVNDRNVVTNSADEGINIASGAVTSGHLIQGNYVGVDPDGASGNGNNDVGIALISGSGNTIRGNVISRNWEGIEVNTANNTIQGNLIGTDASGALNRGNRIGDGIQIQGGANNTTVGGTGGGAGNLIAYNALSGVAILAGSGHQVLGNTIVSNANLGIDIGSNGTTANDPGDVDGGANGQQNFPLLTSANANATGTTIVGSLNSSANTTYRIEFFANRPAVADAGNGEGERYLGFVTVTTDAIGNASINTTLIGVWVNSDDRISANATVDLGGGNYGSTSEFGANVTATSTGIVVVDTTADTVDGTTTSIAALGASRGGDGRISLREAIIAANNTFNGGTPDRIVFAIPVTDANHLYYRDNGASGTFAAAVATTLPDSQINDFDADYAAGSARSWYRISLSGNYLDVTQALIIDGSTQAGYSTGAPVIEINAAGVTTAGDQNAIALTTGSSTIRGLVINSAGDNAVEIDTGAGGSTLVGNYFGTDVSGKQARGNSSVGTWGAIAVKSNNVTIGGTTAADRNLISGNLGYGIELYNSASGTVIQGNHIGTAVDGSAALGNAAAGIYIRNGAANSSVGGTAANQGNLIAHNGGDGIWLDATAAGGHALLGNAITANAGLAIDLAANGVTANDSGDGDAGANNLQNFPVLTTARTDGAGQLTLAGTLNSSASSYFRVEFFANTAQDASGHGEGQTYLGFVNVATNAAGNATISATLAASVPVGSFVTATATRSNVAFNAFTDTSEAARNVAAVSSVQATVTVDTTADVLDGDTTSLSTLLANKGADGFVSLREAIIAANNSANGSSPDRIAFNIAGSGVRTITLAYDGPDAGTTPDALPTISNAVVIDGTSQPGFAGTPLIELNGNNVAGTVKGLVLGAGSDGSTIRGLIVNRFSGTGIEISGTSNHVIQGNWIGLDATGTAAAGNGIKGIYALNANGLLIGGTTAAERNVVSGNAQQGIYFDNVDNSTISGNYVGTNAAGTGDVTPGSGNTLQSGVFLTNGSSGNVVGGTTAGARNVLSGNNHFGFEVLFGSTNNLLQGNYIGTDASGLVALGNVNGGATFWGAGAGNVFGGSAAGARNVISGNTYGGVVVGNASTGAVIEGNYIGVGADGVTALGNGGAGVRVEGGSTGTRVGTNADGSNDAAEGNVIAGNVNGVTVGDSGTSGSVIAGNLIGTDASGVFNRGNTSDGIYILGGATATTVGGTQAVQGNTIAFNGRDGVRVDGATSAGSVILRNAIHGNAALGINLVGGSEDAYGVTANDANDADSGPNGLLNTLTLDTAVTNGSTLVLSTGYSGAPNTYYRIDVYSNAAAEPSGTGEGRTWIGSVNMPIGGSGTNSGSYTFTASVAAGAHISATVTRTNSSYSTLYETSEFSNHVVARAPNTAPAGSDGSITAAEDTTYTFGLADFGFADADGDALLRVWFDTLPASGSLRWNGAALVAGDWVGAGDIALGLLTYVPAPDVNGTAVASFSFRVQDDGGTTLGGADTDAMANTLTIHVSAVNDPPVISSNGGGATASVSVAENQTAVTTVTSGDIDGGAGSYSIVGGADAARFSIDASSGVLTFSAAPDFESPADADGDNVYLVNVRVSDGLGGVDTQAIAVTVTGSNDAPVITSNGGGPAASLSVAENGTAVTTVTSSDVDGGAPSYSIVGGADAARFTIDASSGALAFVTAPSFESPADGGANNVYDVVVQASDGLGGTTTQAIAVTVTDANDAPVAADDRPALELDGVDDFVSVPDSASLTMGATMTMEAWINPDPSANVTQIILNKEGEYEMAIFADGSLHFAFAEGGAWAWHDTGAVIARDTWTHVAVSYDNGTVTTYVNGLAVDSQTMATSTLDDVYPAMNELRIGGRMNNPAGQYFDGRMAEVRVWNTVRSAAEIGAAMNVSLGGPQPGLVGCWSLDQASGTAVADRSGAGNHGTLVNGAGWTGYRTTEDTPLVVTAPGVLGNDRDADGNALTAVLVSGPAHGSLTLNADGSFTYTPDADWSGSDQFSYRASDGAATSNVATVTIVVDPVNDAPAVTSPAAVNAAENQTSVTTVTSSDVDGGAPVYAITGGVDAAWFSIDAATGVLAFSTAPDFEMPGDAGGDNVYHVTVQVNDGRGGTATQAISVTVTNANEAPVITSGAAVSVAENQTAATTVTSSDADGGAPVYAIVGGADAAWFAIDAASGALTFVAAPDFEAPGDADGDNAYQLTVQVSDGLGGSTTQTISVTVANVNEAPVVTSGAAVTALENQTAVATVTSSDVDGGAPAYTIAGGADAGRFAIDAATGVLTFVAAPDFEAPGDANGDNVYQVTIQVSDGNGGTAMQAISVTVTNVNEAPVITSGAAVSVAENQTAATTVTSSDVDGGAPVYAIAGGADAARFSIDPATGALSFVAAPDFEAPGDANGDNAYHVTVQVSDGNGGFATQAVAITVTNVNEAPVVTSGNAVSVAENQTAVVTVTSSDVDGGAPVYAIAGGSDAARFAIDAASGALTFVAAPDAEVPADANGDNVYQVTIQVSDGNGGTAMQAISVTVTNVNEAPVITSGAAVSVAENQTAATTVTSSDVDGGAPVYAIAGGADAARFSIDPATGALSFVAAPDFEAPGDANGDNVYHVTVQVSDGLGASATQAIAVTVTEVNEAPVITSAAAVSVAEGQTAVLTVASSDVDGAVPVYSVVGGADAGRFSIDATSGALTFITAPDAEVPGDADADNVYHVTVQVNDGRGGMAAQAISVTVTNVNEAPVITSGAAVSVAENQTAATTVTSSDVDGGAPVYSIAGGADAARFSIDPATGALSFVAAPDFEAPGDANGDNAYQLTVQVSDGLGGSTTQTISVTVANVNEAPVVTSGAAVTALENQTAVATVTSSDVDGGAPAYTIAGGADAGRFAIDAATGVLTFVAAPDFEAPGDANGDNVYHVTVRVSDGLGGSVLQAIAVTVTDANDAPAMTSGAAVSAAENQTAVTVATSADVDGGAPVYSIAGGADAARFAIDAATGRLWFVAAPDFEAPSDSNVDNVYQLVLGVDDGEGGSAQQAIAVTVTGVNEAPNGIAPSMAWLDERALPGTRVATVTAADPDAGDLLTFTLVTDGQGRFVVDAASGALSVAPGAVFDHSQAASLTLLLRVTDAQGLQTEQTIEIALRPAAAPGDPTLPPPIDPPPAPAMPAPLLAVVERAPDARAEREPSASTATRAVGASPQTQEGRAIDAALAEGEASRASTLEQRLRRTIDDAGDVVASVSFGNDGRVSFESSALGLDDPAGSDAGSLRRLILAALRGAGVQADDPDAVGRAPSDDTSHAVTAALQDPVRVASATLTAGFVWWLTRSGGLLTSILMGIPAWRHVDLLPVLATDRDDEDDLAARADDQARESDVGPLDELFAHTSRLFGESRYLT